MKRIAMLVLGVLAAGVPVSGIAGVFAESSGSVLSCASNDGTTYQVDVTLFPKTIRVNNTYLELQSTRDANDDFKVGVYKQASGESNALFAVKAGYRPVLFENNTPYICS
ncbi:hypothetical protein [Scandinavium goeteborgense]|uniref:Uncharacterized protein n=1 Tax=Scandinavium goeteborgense TaxID=1851514 RepID=A0A4R6EZ06_SCAGO|nr:hypothetical protein [Scandinavium goeteborgense]QKN81972.1 hypothetical protein A8O29_012015 [Scandinavium goeteborgense]TDN64156.1 hypothetical protein EC847_10179 [Scandinavium goeteborgense]